MMRLGAYTCPAGVTHHDKATRVEKWRQHEATAGSARMERIARAHDDYLDGMALFREQVAALLSGTTPQFQAGVEAAVRAMDRSLLDAMRRRPSEEEA